MVQTPEELERFEEVLRSAIEQGATSLSFAGEVIDISDAPLVARQLEQVKETLEKPELSEPPAAAEDLFDEPKEKVAVILKDAGEINSTLLAKPATLAYWKHRTGPLMRGSHSRIRSKVLSGCSG